ncbi:MAG: hypothetical protein K5841_01685 [Fretibacterium sp.]|nr:hypothetical protein [Fretibacterium sp.]
MKRVFGFVAAAVMVMAASMAFAAVQDFGDYTFDIPDGWTASMQSPAEKMDVVSFIKSDNTASGSVTFSAKEGATLEALAGAWAQQLGGSTPTVDADGDYSFTFTAQGASVESQALVKDLAENIYMVVVMTTEDPDAAQELAGILGSFELK